MHSPSQLKRDFLKQWLKGLQMCNYPKKEMSILERKKAIKLSADVAMASTRNATSCWSLALIANASKDGNNKCLVEHLLGQESERLKMASTFQLAILNKKLRSKKIIKKSCSVRRVKKLAPRMVLASSVAKRLAKNRTQLLKSLVPGGESMDEFSLIKETLDYIVSLRVQVDVMRCLANASDLLNCKGVHG
ncbi:hypothetical protein RJ639_016957 [Escallonia herrerae]|uniref:IBH1-like N-terminal domain-containing protein n=1 Tax=Escallonia herrerae TaxID=1293975 RepID=A0AA88VDT6_9ASTE|nr:hypothetical protein RJ639_016957 [Escallonia herrerae]